MRSGWLVCAWIAAGAIVWLMWTPAPPCALHPLRDVKPAADLGPDPEPGRAGAVTGRVVWTGPTPAAPPIPTFEPGPFRTQEDRPNPNAPRLTGSGVADTVVWLRGVDVRRSKPWDHRPVTVEVTDPGFVVSQGETAGKIGIVRRGEAVTFVSRTARLHSARARGPVFFTQMLPEPDSPVRRVVDRSGIVELSSGSGYYWMRAYLIVSDHPYVAVTGADGSFRFDAVPDGTYEVQCWKANWHIAGLESDPETTWPVRLLFRAPVEVRQPVRVAAGGREAVTFTLSAGPFEPR